MRLSTLSKAVFRIFVWFLAVSTGSVIVFRFMPVPVTPLMVQRCLEQSISGKPIVLKKEWVALDDLGERLPAAVIAAEDQKFEEHFGFDLEAIQKARKYNQRHRGKRVRGASTISQQTAKNLFLWPSRSWVRKGFEVYFTFLIELCWSKERILEVYLNIIETGDGIYGAEEAAKEYFGKPSVDLKAREAALIAAVLPNPRRWSPARPNNYISRRAAAIQRAMGQVDFGVE